MYLGTWSFKPSSTPNLAESLEEPLKKPEGTLRLGTWEFPKIGDPNMVPQIAGSLL